MSEKDIDSASGVTQEIHKLAMEQAVEKDPNEYAVREVALSALRGALVKLRKDS